MILCDTNVIIEALKNNSAVIQRIEEIGPKRIAVSIVTAMELYYGALNKAELRKIKQNLSSVRIIQIDEGISVFASELIERYAKSHGLQIPDALNRRPLGNREGGAVRKNRATSRRKNRGDSLFSLFGK